MKKKIEEKLEISKQEWMLISPTMGKEDEITFQNFLTLFYF